MLRHIALGIAAAVLAAPLAASAQDVTIGKWKVSGKEGDCLAGMVHGNQMLMLVSPAANGQNQGAFFLVVSAKTMEENKRYTVKFDGPSPWQGDLAANGMADPNGLWMPFDDFVAETGQAPDRWQFKASLDGTQIADIPVENFKAVSKEVMACAARTR